MLVRNYNQDITSRRIVSFGIGSGYRFEHVSEIKRVYFKQNVSALNMTFRRSKYDSTTLVITLIGDNDESCDVMKISDYFTADGKKHKKAPKLFFYNGIPINLHCNAPQHGEKQVEYA
ncbi:MAG: hypothetical protein K0U45_02580 [Alphaproteobacteria bacterium]|nr:hypothetical protein [Alphaproteobacteria bacterium]